MTEKPLHVRVAEVLGWTKVEHRNKPYVDDERVPWTGVPPADFDGYRLWQTVGNKSYVAVPRYDTEWSATGPLVERFKMSSDYCTAPVGNVWMVIISVWGEDKDRGKASAETLLMAICGAVLSMANDGSWWRWPGEEDEE